VKGLLRPWYRSRLFWLGMPGFVFLLFLWIAFLRTVQTACWTTENSQWFISWGDSNIALGHHLEAAPSWRRELGFELLDESSDSDEELIYFPRAFSFGNLTVGTAQIRDLWISNWFALTLYSTAWISSLVWWQKRKRRRAPAP
jgi:hypothetical protein